MTIKAASTGAIRNTEVHPRQQAANDTPDAYLNSLSTCRFVADATQMLFRPSGKSKRKDGSARQEELKLQRAP